MNNELQKAWDEYKEKHPYPYQINLRDRSFFQIGFNAAFRLFGKSNISNQSSESDKCSSESHALKRMGGWSICLVCDEDISGPQS